MAASMKLYYDKRLKDPTYYIQQGFRNGKKTTTKNIKRLGKHSELLLITDNPLEYAKNEVKKMNEEYRSGRSEFIVPMEFNEKIPGFINRLVVKPGLTGYAQVHGGYEISPEDKIKEDLYYI